MKNDALSFGILLRSKLRNWVFMAQLIYKLHFSVQNQNIWNTQSFLVMLKPLQKLRLLSFPKTEWRCFYSQYIIWNPVAHCGLIYRWGIKTQFSAWFSVKPQNWEHHFSWFYGLMIWCKNDHIDMSGTWLHIMAYI